jgi:hypothetical protein
MPLLEFARPVRKLRGLDVFPSAQVNGEDGRPTPLGLTLLGAGVRSHTVMVVAGVGYLVQLYADNPAAFHRSPELGLASLMSSTRIAVRLDFMRNGGIGLAEAIAEGVRDSALAHGYPDDAELARVRLAFAAAADGKEGKSAVLLLMRDAVIARTNFYLHDAQGALQSFQGSERLCMKVLCHWIGPQVTGIDAVALRRALLEKPP